MTSDQLTLFDEIPAQPVTPKKQTPKKQPPKKTVDLDALANYAILYTATETGKNSGIHYVMTLDDAQKWCSSDVSRGQYMGNKWAYFWTSIANYLTCVWMGESDELDLSTLTDGGSWDNKLDAVGVKKIPVETLPELFAPYGVKVKIPQKRR